MRKLVQTKKTSLNLGEAYDLVLADLLTSLKKIKDKGYIKLGNLGLITKKKSQLRSALNKKIYLFYQISFKASDWLKQELNKAL